MSIVRRKHAWKAGAAATLAAIMVLVLFVLPALAASIAVSNQVVPPTATLHHVGDTINYSETVTNTNANPAVMTVSFIYPNGSVEILDPERSWAVGEEQSYLRDYTVSGLETFVPSPIGDRIQSLLKAEGYEENTFDDILGTAFKSTFVLKPAIQVKKYVDFDGDGTYSDASETYYSGSTASWKVVVTNVGNCPLPTVTLSDTDGHDYGAPFSLAKGASTTLFYSTTGTGDLTTEVTATGVDALGGPLGTVTSSDPAAIDVVDPSIMIKKYVDFDGDGDFSDTSETYYAGDAAWKVVVTNDGDTTLTDLVVTDTNGHAFGPIPSLAAGATQTFEYTTSESADFENVAAVSAQDPFGNPVTDSDAAAVDVVAPSISVKKYVDFDGDMEYSDDSETSYAGDAAWRIVVTNDGDTTLTDVTVEDTNLKSFGPIASLAPGDSETFEYVTSEVADLTNTATAEGTDVLGGTVSDTDAAGIDVISPAITVKKYVDFDGDGTYSDEAEYGYAGPASWKLVVTNTGDVPLTNVYLTDSNGESHGPLALAVGAEYEVLYTSVVTEDTLNIAVAAGTDPLGGSVNSMDSAFADVLAPAVSLKKYVSFDADGQFSDDSETYYAGTATWKIVVTNIGDTHLFDVTVNDSNGKNYGPFDLPFGESATFEYTADVSDDVTNEADVTAAGPLGGTFTDSDDAAVDVVSPSIAVEKSVDFNGDGAFADDSETYYAGPAAWKIVVSNTGDTPLTNVTVTDSNGESFGPIASLAVGASETFQYTSNVVVDDTNVADATGTDPFGNPVSDSDPAAVDVIAPAVSIEKKVDFNADGVYSDSETYYAGATAHWQVVVTNTGDTPITGMVSDSGAGMLGVVLLLPGENAAFSYDAVENMDFTNTASVSATDELGNPLGDSDEAAVDVITPSIEVKKYVDFDGDMQYSDASETSYAGTAAWKIVVTNAGDTALTDVTVDDTNGESFGPIGSLAPGASETFEYTTTEAADLTNTATANGTDVIGGAVSDTDAAAVDVIAPAISVKKYVDFDGDAVYDDEAEYGYAGTASWKLVVKNTGDVALTDVYVTDSNGQTFGPYMLLAGQEVTEYYTDVVTMDTLNLATATGTDPLDEPVSDTDDAFADVITPGVTVEKTVDFDGDGTYGDAETYYTGSPAAWRIVVTNSGDTPLTDVTVSDSNGESFGPIATLAVGASETFEYSTTVGDGVTNTASATGTDPFGNAVTDTDDAAVTVVAPAIAVKKYVDFDGDGTFSDDSETYYAGPAAWKIVVTNTGDTALTDVTVTDSNGESFGPIASLGAGQSETFEYTTNETADKTNTATATGTDVLGSTLTATDVAAVDVVTSSISIKKYVEFNKDGVFSDVSETGYVGDTATWKLVVTNTGGLPLTSVSVSDTNGQTYNVGSLAVGGEWTTTYTTVPTANTTNTASVTGVDTLGTTRTSSDAAAVVIRQRVGATRTIGFWGSHTAYTKHVFEQHLGGTMDLGWLQLTSYKQALGVLLADISKNTDGTSRTPLCQAKVITSQQLVAAILNTGLDNGSSVPLDSVTGLDIISAARAALMGTNRAEIIRTGYLLDKYNNSGLNVLVIDNGGTPIGNTTPQQSRKVAEPAVIDCK